MKHTAFPSDRVAKRLLLTTVVVAGALVLGACGGGPDPILVEVTSTPTPVPEPTPEPSPLPEPTPTPLPTAAPATPTEVPEEDPLPVWTVVDTVARLNVRADPTTSADIVAELASGDSGLVGTGETATADGFDWVQLEATDDRPLGWVAVEFLVADESGGG